MPVRLLVDGKCLIRIFGEEGFLRAGSDGERVILERPGADPAIILRPTEQYSYTEIADWLFHADISLDRFEELRQKHCAN